MYINNISHTRNVKKTKPYFKNHIQPRIPLNDFYYNQNDVETLKWQANLAKKYNIFAPPRQNAIYLRIAYRSALCLRRKHVNEKGISRLVRGLGLIFAGMGLAIQ